MDPAFSHFIALTAANINARDGLLTGMLSHLVQQDQKEAVLHALLNSDLDQANVSANLDEIYCATTARQRTVLRPPTLQCRRSDSSGV